jgi:hypothetical protein
MTLLLANLKHRLTEWRDRTDDLDVIADIKHRWEAKRMVEIPRPCLSYAMTPTELADECTYRNYKYNRLHSPATTPDQWRSIYGVTRTQMFEERFQNDRERT